MGAHDPRVRDNGERMNTRIIGFSLAALTATALLGCDRPGCDGKDYVAEPNAPVVTKLELVQQLTERGDPWTLVFGVQFTDANGDVGAGKAEVFLNGSTTPTILALSDDFGHSNVDLQAKSGRIAIPLRFNDSVQDASTVRFGLQLVDAAQLRSNCYSLDLSFTVKPAAQAATQFLNSLWTQT